MNILDENRGKHEKKILRNVCTTCKKRVKCAC